MSKYRVIEETSDEEIKKAEVEQEKKVKKAKKAKKKDKEKGKMVRKAGETISELKKVTWPKFSEIVTKTGVVLAFCAISLVLLLLIDLVLGFLTSLL